MMYDESQAHAVAKRSMRTVEHRIEEVLTSDEMPPNKRAAWFRWAQRSVEKTNKDEILRKVVHGKGKKAYAEYIICDRLETGGLSFYSLILDAKNMNANGQMYKLRVTPHAHARIVQHIQSASAKDTKQILLDWITGVSKIIEEDNSAFAERTELYTPIGMFVTVINGEKYVMITFVPLESEGYRLQASRELAKTIYI